jgi:DNA modification methylase
MPTYATNERFTLYQGDNRVVLKELANNSVDSIVTDPPYELGFMGKKWDASGIAFNVEVWQECLRVLKPGGHLLAFSGSRTYHRMAVAIEDAGFEIRDQIMWIYGSGFPKSLDVSKAIDKAAGLLQHEGKNFRNVAADTTALTPTIKPSEYVRPEPKSENAKQWQGWGTALKPAHEPIVLARKPLIGTVAENVLTYGTGGLNIDGGRVGSTVETWPASRSYAPGQIQPGGKGQTQATGEVPAGRWPANVIHDGSDEVVKLFPDTGKSTGGRIGKKSMGNVTNVPAGEYETGDPGYGDFGTAARFFYCAKASKKDRNEGLDGFEEKRASSYGYDIGLGNAGEGMFKERNPIKQNHHPTVKPTTLMEYLCKLVTPPNGIVLDPFMGSGSTGKAAMYAGFNFIGIEMTEEYLPIAKARIEFAKGETDAHLPIHL